MKRILVTGISGQLAPEVVTALTPWGEVVAGGREMMDLSKGEEIREAIASLKPQIIVNCGAYTAVDKAESEPDLAGLVNGVAPTILAEEAAKLDATLLHVSTDYVFDGKKNTPYLETDPTNPIGVYGSSKLAGEEGIIKSDAPYYILRTAWVYGTRGKGNFVKTMLRLGKEREELRVVMDQVGSPSWTRDIAGAIASLLKEEPPIGIYHFTNSGVTSWYDFAVAIFEEAKLLGFPLQIKRVIPITTHQYPTPAKRPAYSVLSHQKLVGVSQEYAPHWRVALRKMLAEF